MPSVKVYFRGQSVGGEIVELLVENLPEILSDALATEKQNFFVIPHDVTPDWEILGGHVEDLMLPQAGQFVPDVFIDILAKDKPERRAGLEESHRKIAEQLRRIIPKDSRDKDYRVGLRIVLAPLVFGYITD